MFGTIIGHSENTDTMAASRDVIKQCLSKLGDMRPSACLVFASTWYDFKRILGQVTSAFPGIPLSGCSSGGEITSDSGFRYDIFCITPFGLDSIFIATAIRLSTPSDPLIPSFLTVLMIQSDVTDSSSPCLAYPNNPHAFHTHNIHALHQSTNSGCLILGKFIADTLNPLTSQLLDMPINVVDE